MAWPSQKNAWRKRLNVRWLRWAFLRAMFRVLPLRGYFSFSMNSIPAIEDASTVITDITTTETAAFTPEQETQLLGPAAVNDKRYDLLPATSATFIRQAAIVPQCAVFGHTGVPVRARDSAMLTVYGGYTPNWNFAKPKRLKERVVCDGLVTSVKGRHYFHFIEHMLPVLNYLLQEHKPDTPLTVLVPGNGSAFQYEICAAVTAGFPDVTFEPLGTDEKAVIDQYLWLHDASGMAEWLPASQENAAAFRQLMLRHYELDDATQGGQRMFFSRGKAKQRCLLNEPELEAIANARGFERFEAHSGNHKEQVRQFANADMIVAVHGAGLTNLLFARPGTTVIEMFPDNCVKSTYLWLSARLGLKYHALMGSAGDYQQAFTVDSSRFTAALDDIL